MILKDESCMMCGAWEWKIVHFYHDKPFGETDFHLVEEEYYRALWQCQICKLVVNVHSYDLSRLYEGGYGKATYGDMEGVRKAYDRVMSLGQWASDNLQRCEFLRWKMSQFVGLPNVLDVGSGLGVFPSVMKNGGNSVTAVESDPLFVEHLRGLGLTAVDKPWMEVNTTLLPETYNLITFNKVLEHVQDPVLFLNRAVDFCDKDSLLYVEVPSVAAAKEGYENREEFYIEHCTVWSPVSVCLLVESAGLRVKELYDLIEPSGKYTLRVLASL